MLPREALAYIFRPDKPGEMEHIPLLEQRVKVLREAGQVLVDKFNGSIVNCIKHSNNDAMQLLELIVENFESYQDEHTFMDQKVYLYKRAQILIADLWSCFEGQGLCEFKNIDYITMFADYRVPQALVHFDILQYSDFLMDILKKGEKVSDSKSAHLLRSGDRLEIEIRGNSIWAVELIRKEIVHKIQHGHKDKHINAILLDFYIWDYSKTHAKEMMDIPIHHTRSIHY